VSGVHPSCGARHFLWTLVASLYQRCRRKEGLNSAVSAEWRSRWRFGNNPIATDT